MTHEFEPHKKVLPATVKFAGFFGDSRSWTEGIGFIDPEAVGLSLVDREIAKRAKKFVFLEPEACRQDPRSSAQTMLEILAENYGAHNLTSNLESLAQNISVGNTQVFICADRKTGQNLSCAALIKLSETEVEIGRAACRLNSRNNGHALPILLAFKAWKEGRVFPESEILRAEVRTAKPTRQVPGSQETQTICFEKLGLVPTAVGPFFHHGLPDRQEMFFLASCFRDLPTAVLPAPTINFPTALFDDRDHLALFEFFWSNLFGCRPQINHMAEVSDGKIFDQTDQFHLYQEGPLLIVEPFRPEEGRAERPILPEILAAFHEGIRFALAKIPLTKNPEMATQALALGRIGFRVIGFQPVLKDKQLELELFLGALSSNGREKLVAPVFIENHFSHGTEDLLIKDFLWWRITFGKGGGF